MTARRSLPRFIGGSSHQVRSRRSSSTLTFCPTSCRPLLLAARLAAVVFLCTDLTLGDLSTAGDAVSEVEPLRTFGRVNPQSTWGNFNRFTTDGKRVVTTGRDGAVMLWNLATGECEQSFRGNDRRPAAAVSANGQLIAVSQLTKDRRRKLVVYDLAGGHSVLEVDMDRDFRASFTNDASLLAVQTDGVQGVRLIEIDSGLEVGVVFPNTQSLGRAGMQFSPDGRLLAIAGDRKEVEVWNLFQGGAPKRLSLEGRNVRATSLAFIDGERLAVGVFRFDGGQRRGGVEFFDVASGTSSALEFREQNQSGEGRFLLSNDRSILVTIHQDRFVVWDVERRVQRSVLKFDNSGSTTARISAATLSPDNKLLYANQGNALAIWDLRTGQQVQAKEARHRGAIQALAVSPDDRYVASGARDGAVLLWDTKSDQLPRKLMQASNWVHNLAFLGGGAELAICAEGHEKGEPGKGFVEILSVDDGKSVRRWNLAARAFGLGVSSDERLLAFATGPAMDAFAPYGGPAEQQPPPNELQLWDLEQDKLIRTLSSFRGEQRSRIDFSAEGESIYLISRRGVTGWGRGEDPRVVPDQSWLQDRYVTDPRQRVSQFDSEYDPQSGRLFTSGYVFSRTADRMAFVACWDAAAGTLLWEVQLDELIARRLVLSPRGRLLAIACGSGQLEEASRLLLVDAATGRRLQAVNSPQLVATAFCFSSDGERIYSGGPDGQVRVWDVSAAYRQPGE